MKFMVCLLRSALIPAPHGFPTRQGGISPAPFDSLNLSFQVGDAAANVKENLNRLARGGEFPLERLVTVQQVHGDRVVWAEDLTAGGLEEADALVNQKGGPVLGIRVADCVPILMSDPAGQTVAAVHSGWRGTDLEIASRTVEALARAGVNPSHLRVAMGPHIRSCCYEVSAELAAKFENRFGVQAVQRRQGRHFLDLSFAVCASLQRAGVLRAHVDVLEGCTHCDSKRFFSHRRDRGQSGRHLAFIGCAP